MDVLNEMYPLYPENPYPVEIDSASNTDNEEIRHSSPRVRRVRRYYNNRNRVLPYELWCLRNSDELWYFWCMCKEHLTFNILPFFNKMNYEKFCKMCYHNS